MLRDKPVACGVAEFFVGNRQRFFVTRVWSRQITLHNMQAIFGTRHRFLFWSIVSKGDTHIVIVNDSFMFKCWWEILCTCSLQMSTALSSSITNSWILLITSGKMDTIGRPELIHRFNWRSILTIMFIKILLGEIFWKTLHYRAMIEYDWKLVWISSKKLEISSICTSSLKAGSRI